MPAGDQRAENAVARYTPPILTSYLHEGKLTKTSEYLRAVGGRVSHPAVLPSPRAAAFAESPLKQPCAHFNSPPATIPSDLVLAAHCKAPSFTENATVAPGDLPMYWQEGQSKKTTIILAKPFEPHLSAHLPHRLAQLPVALESTKKLYRSHYGLLSE